ncbi:hypothetical protein KQ096_003000 [Salmonella enterica]|nr:hypothetical protein [Salmonella enterica]
MIDWPGSLAGSRRYARQGMGGRSPIPTAQYCAGFFFYDSEASRSMLSSMMMLVSNGSSPPLPAKPGFHYHATNRAT